MLRKIRTILAIFFFVSVTLLFLDFTGTWHTWMGWMAKIQFLPALLALNAGVVAMLVVLTLLFGRIYCSVICPLGVMQDIVSWISGRRKKKKFRFSYSPALKWLRYGMLGVLVIALVAGIGPIALVEEGDIIKIDIPNLKLELDVSDEELAKRKAAWTPREPKVTPFMKRRSG